METWTLLVYNEHSGLSLWTLVRNGKAMPIEKYRQAGFRALIFLSAAPYALTQDQIDYVMSCPELERDAWFLGYAKSAQQKLWYILFFPIIAIIVINVIIRLFNSYVMLAILNDHLNKKVFTDKGVQPNDLVKKALGLKKDKSWMELYASPFNYPCAKFLTFPTLLMLAVTDQANSVPSADLPRKPSKMKGSRKMPVNVNPLLVPYREGNMMHTSMTCWGISACSTGMFPLLLQVDLQ